MRHTFQDSEFSLLSQGASLHMSKGGNLREIQTRPQTQECAATATTGNTAEKQTETSRQKSPREPPVFYICFRVRASWATQCVHPPQLFCTQHHPPLFPRARWQLHARSPRAARASRLIKRAPCRDEGCCCHAQGCREEGCCCHAQGCRE